MTIRCVHGSIDSSTNSCVCDSGWINPTTTNITSSVTYECSVQVTNGSNTDGSNSSVPFYQNAKIFMYIYRVISFLLFASFALLLFQF